MNKQFTKLVELAAATDREIEYTSERIIVRPSGEVSIDKIHRPVYVYTPVSFVPGHEPNASYYPGNTITFRVNVDLVGVFLPTYPTGTEKNTASLEVVDSAGVDKLGIFTDIGYPAFHHNDTDVLPMEHEVILHLNATPPAGVVLPATLTMRFFNLGNPTPSFSQDFDLVEDP